MKRALSFALAISVLAGCTSTNTVPSHRFVGLQGNGENVVHTADGEAIRLDPNSKIRFRRTDGSDTPWTQAGDLWVNDEGFYIQRFLPIASLTGARVEGLDEAGVTALKATAPSSDALEDEGKGSFQLVTKGAELQAWIDAFRAAIAAKHPPTEAEEKSHQSVCASADLASTPHCKTTFAERALARLDPALLGKWTFRVEHGDWIGPYQKAALADVFQKGVEARDGLKWSDVESAEIQNFSGGKTLVAVVGITAAAVGLVAVAMVARKLPAPNLGQAAGAVVETTARSANIMLHVTAHSHGGGGGGSDHHASSNADAQASDEDGSTTLWKPGYELPDADKGGRRIFGGVARRRSIVRVVASADLAAGPFGPRAPWSSGVIPTLRFADFFEIGGGIRFIGRGLNGDQGNDLVKLFRIGMHAELDAYRRFAFPLMFDVGAGGDVALHARVAWGLRFRATEHLSFGIYPLNPTYTRYRSPIEVPRWTFPSGIETSFAF